MMKSFWFVKIQPFFKGRDEKTGETIIFRDWRENVIDVKAHSIEDAKAVAAFTGILENIHYHDIIEEIANGD